MSDRSKYSHSERGTTNSNFSDDDFSTSSTRDKFKRERSLDGHGSYVDSYEPKNDDYGRYSRNKRHLRSSSPDSDQRHKYRRTLSISPPPPPPPASSSPLTQHSHRYRGNYTRSNRERERDRDGEERGVEHAEGDHYIPNYERDGYTPGARYGRNTEQKQQQQQNQHYHQRSRRRHSQLPPQHQQRHRHHQLQQQPTSKIINFGMLENMNSGAIVGNRSPMSRMPMMNFQQLDYIIPFKQYCDYLRQTQPKAQLTDDEIQKQYDDYKESITNKLSIKFFNNNKEKQWFLEKYHPQTSKLYLDNMKQRRLHNFSTFMQGLEKGQYDAVQFDVDSNSTIDKNDTDDVNGDNKSLPTDNTSGSSIENYENHLIIKTVPPTISRQKIIDMCSQVDGFQYLALSEPSVTKKFHRIGWIHFSEETDMQKVFDQLDNQKVDDFVFHLAMNRKHQTTSGRYSREAPDITNTFDRLSSDLDQATKLAKKYDVELEKDGLKDVMDNACKVIERNNSTITTDNAVSSVGDENVNEVATLASTKKKLDMVLVYLRQVYMYCYYCGLECDSTEELNRRCLDPHLRKLRTPGDSESKQPSKNERMSQQWLQNLDQRIGMKINSWDDESIVKIGGKSLKSETDAFLAEHVEKEHDAKYKCKVGDCAKAFKGIEFVEKHISSKHGDEIQQLKDDVTFYNNYICDPNHLLIASNNNNNNYGAISTGINMGNMMNNGSNSGVITYGSGGPSFLMNTSPGGGLSLQGASVGTPWDQIPRIGFGGNVGWSASMAGRLGGRLGSTSDQGNIPSASTMPDLPQDPRQVKSYIDLDAPADGDSNISFY